MENHLKELELLSLGRYLVEHSLWVLELMTDENYHVHQVDWLYTDRQVEDLASVVIDHFDVLGGDR